MRWRRGGRRRSERPTIGSRFGHLRLAHQRHPSAVLSSCGPAGRDSCVALALALLPEKGLRATPSVQLPGTQRLALAAAAHRLGSARAALGWADPAPPSGFAGIPDPGPALEALLSLLGRSWRFRSSPAQAATRSRWCPVPTPGRCSHSEALLLLRWLKPPPRAVVKPSLAFLLFPEAFSGAWTLPGRLVFTVRSAAVCGVSGRLAGTLPCPC